MNISFKEWMQAEGQEVYDEVIEWVDNAPGVVDLEELGIFEKDEYAFGICEIRFESREDDYNAYMYELYCDRTLDDD